MKLEKNSLILISFLLTLGVLVVLVLLTVGFEQNLKYLIGAIYFAFWVAALVYLSIVVIIPYLATRKVQRQEKVKAESERKAPKRDAARSATSPRSGLPLRDRISAYVAERRKEEGLPAPEPLMPSRSGTPAAPARVKDAVVAASAVGAGVVAAEAVSEISDEKGGDLPLPDDFDMAGSGDFTLDEEPSGDIESGQMDDLGDFLDESGDESSPDISADTSNEMSLPDVEEGGDDGLPDINGDLSPDISESDLDSDDDMMDISDDESIPDADEDLDSGLSEESEVSDGDLSEEGLDDMGDMMEPDMIDGDMNDDDLSDIEFADLEPDEE